MRVVNISSKFWDFSCAISYWHVCGNCLYMRYSHTRAISHSEISILKLTRFTVGTAEQEVRIWYMVLVQKFPLSKINSLKNELTFNSHRHRLHLESENRMQILLLTVSRHSHATSKESDMPHKYETYSKSTVHAEYSHRLEWAEYTDPKWNHIRYRCNGDRYSCIGQHQTHAFGYAEFHWSASPCR